MHTITATNVNDAYEKGMHLIDKYSEKETSRVGEVFATTCPLTTVYAKPRQRVLWYERRDANPFFHLIESLWMLTGRNDVKPMQALVGRMGNFSDDKKVFHGAYGYRWRKGFGFDQIHIAINMLRRDPTTRRCVIGMWSPENDMEGQGLDLPCNLSIAFRVIGDTKLNMTVFNRSNDLIMGAYGANAVHMSMLQEFIANNLGLEVGTYWQVSNNAHVYVKDFVAKWSYEDTFRADLYELKLAVPFPSICNNIETWVYEADEIVNLFCGQELTRTTGGRQFYENNFLEHVALPMALCYRAYKAGDLEQAVSRVNGMYSGIDWTIAAKRWLYRRGVHGVKDEHYSNFPQEKYVRPKVVVA